MTNLSSNGRIWSAVGDDRHRIVTMVDFINFAESYAFALILSDRHDLLDCATRPGDYFNEGCQVIDIDNVLPHDQMQDYLYRMNSPLYEPSSIHTKRITPYLPKVGTIS